MKVFMIAGGYPTIDNPQNGIFAFDQAKALAENTSHHVMLGVMDLRSAFNKRRYGIYQDRKDNIDITVCSFPLGAVPDEIYEHIGRMLFPLLFKKMVRVYGMPDIIHAQFGNMGIIVERIATKKKVPLVITEHASSLNNSQWDEKTKNKYSYLFNKANATICVSNALKENIYKNTSCEAFVIPNIVDLRNFCYQKNKPHNCFTFICVANLVQIKNHDLLIQAFYKLCKENQDKQIHLSVVGDGPNRKYLESKVNRLGLDNVKFYGRVSRKDISKLFDSSDAFILTSKSETFGVAFIEALASGLPVISTPCGGPMDFITPECGIVISEDVDAVCEAMKTMIDDYSEFDRKAFSKHFREAYSPEMISKAISNVYMGIREKGPYPLNSKCQNNRKEANEDSI